MGIMYVVSITWGEYERKGAKKVKQSKTLVMGHEKDKNGFLAGFC